MVTTNYKMDSDEPDFSDPEDFVDDISNEEMLPELYNKEPRLEISTEKIIIIDNIPTVGVDKKDKLKKIMQNMVSNYGKVVHEFYPEDDKQCLLGYMFIEFDNEISAQEAVSQLNGFRLDKLHTFKVNFFSDIDQYKNVPLTEVVEEPAPYRDPGQLLWWLTQPECFDQYCMLYGDIFTSVYMNSPTQPTMLESREKWTETRFQWSPKGTYLATFHDRGIALWAGEHFKQFMRFSHHGVQLIDFSPCEKYLVTCNPTRAGIDDQALIIWCTRSGQKRRSFSYERSISIAWPYFRWNADDKYFARLATDSLLIYDTDSFTLLDKKSIKIPHIADFEWSPVNNIISYSIAEDKNELARIVLMEIPSKTEIRSKNSQNVVECKLYWQNMGDFLCVRVERYKKCNIVKEDEKDTPRYTGIYYNLEFFRIRGKDIPVDSIEIKESIFAFAWEPYGQRFAIIYGESSNRTTIAFYRIVNATPNMAGKLELIKEFKNRTVTQIFWAPLGQHCVCATLHSKAQTSSPVIEYFDVQQTDVQMLNRIEHDKITDCEWDPTGRYFLSYVSYWTDRQENAYSVTNFQGKQMYRTNLDKLYKISWRPTPASILSADHKKEIRKNLKTYSEKYNAADRLYGLKVSKEILEKRRSMMDTFMVFRTAANKRFADMKQKLAELRDNFDHDNEEYVEVPVQFLVETKKEEVPE